MGMFDNINCAYPLPLTDKLRNLKVSWLNTVFQTKDLDNSLASYFITKDGVLFEEVIERDYIPFTEEERKEAKVPLWSMWKEVFVKNKYLKRISHHGVINFYDSFPYDENQDIWVEFNAYFVYGNLDKIELCKTELHKSQSITNKEIEEQMTKRRQRPWNRFKNLMGYVGWYWFWRKIASVCGKLYSFFSKLQTIIYRTML